MGNGREYLSGAEKRKLKIADRQNMAKLPKSSNFFKLSDDQETDVTNDNSMSSWNEESFPDQMKRQSTERKTQNSSKHWAEGSIWSTVCAMELGLVRVGSSLKREQDPSLYANLDGTIDAYKNKLGETNVCKNEQFILPETLMSDANRSDDTDDRQNSEVDDGVNFSRMFNPSWSLINKNGKKSAGYVKSEKPTKPNAKLKPSLNKKKNKRRQYTKRARPTARKNRKKVIQIIERRNYTAKNTCNGENHSPSQKFIESADNSRYSGCAGNQGDAASSTEKDLEIEDVGSHKTSGAKCRDRRVSPTDCSDDEIHDDDLRATARSNFFEHEFDIDCTLSLRQTITEFVRDKHNYALLPSQMKSAEASHDSRETIPSQTADVNEFRSSVADVTADEFDVRHSQSLSERITNKEDEPHDEESPSQRTAANEPDDHIYQGRRRFDSQASVRVEIVRMVDGSLNSGKASIGSPVFASTQKSPSEPTLRESERGKLGSRRTQLDLQPLVKLDRVKREVGGRDAQTFADTKMEDSGETTIGEPVASPVRRSPIKSGNRGGAAKKDDGVDEFPRNNERLSPLKLSYDRPNRTVQSLSRRSTKDKFDERRKTPGSQQSDFNDDVKEEPDSPKSQSSGNNCRSGDEKMDVSLSSNGTSSESPVFSCIGNSPSKRRSRRDARRANEKTGLRSIDMFSDSEENRYHDIRRVTRGLVRNETEVIEVGKNRPGKLVWGSCMGWWPALVVDADDAGMAVKPDKIWVYWVGEGRISQLREKTQVEPFSTDLEARLVTALRSQPDTDLRYRVSVATLKLLSERFGNPLSKPYHTWAQKNLLTRSKLNELDFYPYPREIKKILEKLREKNIKITEKVSQEKEHNQKQVRTANKNPSPGSSPEKKQRNYSTANGTQKQSNEQPSNPLTHQNLPLIEQKAGAIVWAKICGHSWWPAMIIDNQDVGAKEPSFGCQWIMWYGDYRLSQVDHQKVWKFEEGIKKMCDHAMQSKRETYVTGVLNACKDYCHRQGIKTDEWTMADVSKWVSSWETSSETSTRNNTVITTDEKYSSHILTKLKEIKSNQEVDAEREHSIENSDALKSVFAGSSKLETLCLICLKCFDDGVIEHPFFEGILCNACSEDYKPTVFAYGEDGKSFYCTLCAGSDTVAICDGYDCPRVYCTACLKYLICPETYDEILLRDPWTCFLCEDSQGWVKNGLVKPRSDWRERVVRLFRSNSGTDWDQVRSYNGKKRKIRVLSLFDGLSTGLLVLKKLGIEIEVYYASEINPDAMLVSLANFGDQIHRLGDVRAIKKEEIERIAPIDLLIGGSPCNDLSIVNPNRLGLHDPNGTGVLFFDYCRIMKLLNAANDGHHLFWLFENVASMPCKYRLEINKYLGCEPNMIDSADFSPQHRPRLYWSNLPIGCNSLPLDPSLDLQSVLTPNCDRHALVKKIQTVTTKVNSLKQGKALLKPVLMNGEKDSLWITELEAIFGFPRHFTDVKNLSATKRQKLIGQSWSVQTLCAIMRPLRYFFEVSKEADQ